MEEFSLVKVEGYWLIFQGEEFIIKKRHLENAFATLYCLSPLSKITIEGEKTINLEVIKGTNKLIWNFYRKIGEEKFFIGYTYGFGEVRKVLKFLIKNYEVENETR